MELLLATLGTYLVSLPVLLVWLVGLALSILLWKRHPKVSLLALTALVILLATRLISSYLNIWLPLEFQEQGLTPSQIGPIIAVQGILTSLITAFAWGLLLAAVFGWRRQPATAGEE